MVEDRAKWMEGKKGGSTEPEVFITGEMPNPQSKNRVSYNYRTPTETLEVWMREKSPEGRSIGGLGSSP
jgi:hypothetical protein